MRLLGSGLMAGLALVWTATGATAGWVPYPPGNEPSNAAQVHQDRLRARYVRLSGGGAGDAVSVSRRAGRHRHQRYRIVYRAVPQAWVRDHGPPLAGCCDVPFGLEHRLVDFRDAPAPAGYRVAEHRRVVARRKVTVIKVRG